MDNSYKTAIARKKASAPTRWAFKNGYINSNSRVFDWGCGKGADMRWLKEQGCTVWGYDPHYAPVNHPKHVNFEAFNVILCNYVFNVIENENIRYALLDSILKAAAKDTYIIISVRSEKEIERCGEKGDWHYRTDGRVTKTGTFQKGFHEFEIYDMVDDRVAQMELKKLSGNLIHVFSTTTYPCTT